MRTGLKHVLGQLTLQKSGGVNTCHANHAHVMKFKLPRKAPG
jgi:hypothetical protein